MGFGPFHGGEGLSLDAHYNLGLLFNNSARKAGVRFLTFLVLAGVFTDGAKVRKVDRHLSLTLSLSS